ncbi:carbon-phosphorus lyase [Fictibacillus arsenicus]|uniref:Carbon-phosphorus lyase n=1 Tax=Fictibacillus arsenicus TaxID=255247 RepID=A0A1B1Z8N6_9BACL|nr:MBL fold metallo-hydrolase [Fictibacillus arsenicus]ANX13808.1 carbon-phosphorus lyase [Fictibacillus arsenicus]
MKLHILGTAASEGFPALFCRCEHCLKARQLGGKNIRTRTSAIIDDTIKIDFPPDTLHHVLCDALDLSKIEHLLFTHTHHDHFYPEDLNMRLPGYAHGVKYPLHIHGNDAALAKCSQTLKKQNEHVKLHLLKPFQTHQIGDALVTPLLADHNQIETCLLFHIKKGNTSLLYGHDTGWFPDETWIWLENTKVDIALLDCTNGNLQEYRNHMNVNAVIETKNRLQQSNVLSDQSKVYVTHFSHNIGLLHEDLIQIFQPHDIEVAYDGLIIKT